MAKTNKRSNGNADSPSTNGTQPAAGTVRTTGFFVMRTPLLPIDDLVAWSDGLSAVAVTNAGDSVQLAAALAADRERLRERLRGLVERPEIAEAIFVASPSLDESLPLWLADPESERGQKVERALVRYLQRMTTRPTPFGTFAGCSLGRVDVATRLEMAGRNQYRRHTRLDTDFLSSLSARLVRDPKLRQALTFRPNSSLYRIAGRMRYAEEHLAGRARSYRLVAVDASEYLLSTLERARAGARLEPLAAALVDDELTLDETRAFIIELVEAQLLVPDLRPQITGVEPIHDLIEQLEAAAGIEPSARAACEALAEARATLAALDGSPLGASPARYRAMHTSLQEKTGEVELSRMFQVDLVKPAPKATLGAEPLAELARAVAMLHRWSARFGGADGLQGFRRAFEQRYESRCVALTEVLDEELGIGFEASSSPSADASPLLAGLPFGGGLPGPGSVGPQVETLAARLQAMERSGATELVLDDATVALLAGPESDAWRRPLPGSLAAMVTVAAASPEEIDAGQFQLHLQGISGPSGVNLLGRFCHGDGPLTKQVRAHLREEEAQRPDAMFVEVVHLPEGRIGNVVLRPQLRGWELTFLGRSGAPAGRQLTLEDLDVSVVDGRVILRSRSLGREVIPRLTTAHNFASPTNLGAYRFLCALQMQRLPRLHFSWDTLEMLPHLPRVRVGRTILSLARWRLDKDALTPLIKAVGDERFVEAQRLRQRLRLPRWVSVADLDNVLPVDFDNVLSVETFVKLVKERPAVAITEFFGLESACASGPEGRFTHELVVPLIANADAAEPKAGPLVTVTAPPTGAQVSPQRQFLVGSEWLYAKLYTGSATVDALLREEIAPIVAAAMGSGAADQWFFLRYGDPDWHLRLRFHGEPARLLGEVLPLLTAAADRARAAGRVWKLQLDSYEREIERYGGNDGMLVSEAIFCADSEAALAIVQRLVGDAGKDAAWRLALRGMDQLLDDLGLTLQSKHALLVRIKEGFSGEFGAQGALMQKIGERFRSERLALESLLERSQDAASELAPGFAALSSRSEQLIPLAARLQEAARVGRLQQPVAALAASYLHMYANRLLPSSARAQELVLYDFLERLYKGQLARSRNPAVAARESL